MDTFDLEEEKMKSEVSQVSDEKTSSIKKIPFIIGIIIISIAFLDMIILFAVPYQRINHNKHKLPDANFKKPSDVVIALHFILHVSVILVGVFTLLFSFKNYEKISHQKVQCGLITVCIICFFIWILEVCFDFHYTENTNSKMTVDQLISILTRNPPVEFAFLYSKDEVSEIYCTPDCQQEVLTCYSKSGIVIPIKSSITLPIYNFSNVPELFYFTIQQQLDMSVHFRAYFNMIMQNAQKCDPDYEKVVEYFPVIAGTYITSLNDKIPSYLSKATRIVSILFGVGVYYELNSKSVPYITHTQRLDADAVAGVDYNSIFTASDCASYGQCSIYNSKPKPD